MRTASTISARHTKSRIVTRLHTPRGSFYTSFGRCRLGHLQIIEMPSVVRQRMCTILSCARAGSVGLRGWDGLSFASPLLEMCRRQGASGPEALSLGQPQYPNLAPQMRVALPSIASNTGANSPGELEITSSASEVAACCPTPQRASFPAQHAAHATEWRAFSPSFRSNEACDRAFGFLRLCETRSPRRHVDRPASGQETAPPPIRGDEFASPRHSACGYPRRSFRTWLSTFSEDLPEFIRPRALRDVRSDWSLSVLTYGSRRSRSASESFLRPTHKMTGVDDVGCGNTDQITAIPTKLAPIKSVYVLPSPFRMGSS